MVEEDDARLQQEAAAEKAAAEAEEEELRLLVEEDDARLQQEAEAEKAAAEAEEEEPRLLVEEDDARLQQEATQDAEYERSQQEDPRLVFQQKYKLAVFRVIECANIIVKLRNRLRKVQSMIKKKDTSIKMEILLQVQLRIQTEIDKMKSLRTQYITARDNLEEKIKKIQEMSVAGTRRRRRHKKSLKLKKHKKSLRLKKHKKSLNIKKTLNH